jgi:N6-adenosine-specific RNA methylase IME4
MTHKLIYSAVREHPRKVIHVVRVVDQLLPAEDIDEIAARMRQYALNRYGEQDAAVVVVQGDTKETLQPFDASYAVAAVRAAMFNAALQWRDFEPE